MMMGNFFFNGLNGFKRSIKRAFEYFKMAADQGNKQAQYCVAECFRQGGFDFKESWEDALMYYRLSAKQGDLRSIRLLFDWYYYGKHVEESLEEAVKFLQIGAQIGDAECQSNLGYFYENGLGNLPCSFLQAIKYYRLAAAQGYKRAQQNLEFRHSMLHSDAQVIDMSAYLFDRQLSTLQSIFRNHGDSPIFLNEYEFTLEEAHVICNAMLENPNFTVICSKESLDHLHLAFKLNGYEPSRDCKYQAVTFSSRQPHSYACVFIPSEGRAEHEKQAM